jgi:hypothetical protein
MGKIRRFAGAWSAPLFALLPTPARALEGGTLPILFAPNRGQCPPEVLFQARTGGLVASVTADGLHLDLEGRGLRLRFVEGAAHGARGLEPSPARVHYLAPRPVRDVVPYARVRLLELLPGVDLELYAQAGRLEYDLCLAPGAEPDAIRLSVEGADSVAVDGAGSLCARIGDLALLQLAPRAWQEEGGGERRAVTCAWSEREDGTFGFDLGARGAGAALLIDPVLVYSTHVGGSNADEGNAVAVDGEGSVYVAGWARSADFPAAGARAARGKDAVVFKLAGDGSGLEYATYLGGRGDDCALALVLGRSGEVVVAGTTESDDFPTTPDALRRSAAGGLDGFVARLSPDGSGLRFATRLGGSAEDVVSALALTPSGQITVAGGTRSRDFPLSPGSRADAARGARDAFVARLDPLGERLVFSERLGGAEDDEALGLAVDAQGCAYVTGRTESHDFPTTLGAQDRERCGVDAFVAKLSGGGRTLLYSTFLGGSGQDEGRGIAVDARQRAVVVGWTQSLDFPFDAGREARGRKDGFAVCLTEMGNALAYATPLSGGSADEALAVALDPRGGAWVVGRTRSTDFPVTRDAHQARLAGACDAFFARLSGEDGALRYATLLGAQGEDELRAVAADALGATVALCGASLSLTLEERGPLSGRRRGPADAFVLRFAPDPAEPVTPQGALQAGLGLGF